MSFLFSRSNSSSSSSEADFSPYPPYSSHTLSAILASLPTDDSGSFVGTVLPTSVSHSPSSHGPGGYGYLSSYPTLILGLNDLHDLVQIISKHLDVETPFVFSNGSTTTDSGVPVAIDLDAGRVKRLIDKYVGHLISKNSGRQGQTVVDFDDEARFAGPHELGMLLRWGLARVIRIESTASHSTGTSSRALTRGLIPYLAYLNWAKQESLLGYPSSHFGGLLDTRTRVSVPVRVRDEFGGEEVVFKDEYKEVIPKLLRETLLTLLALLAKLVAHSAKSGVTPPGLSPLFGPLLFGLGPLPTELISSSSTVNTPDPTSFESTYTAYLRSVHATEHCLFAFIRWQDTPPSQGGGGFGGVGGVPGRLKEWIKDYPRTLSGHSRILAIADLLQSGGRRSKDQHSLGPRKGAKTVRVLAVRRTVPAYDADLVRSSARWGLPSYAATGGAGLSSNSLPGNKEWGRINPPVQVQQGGKGKGGRLAARYSESYRKKMNIPPGVEPGSSPYAPPLSSLSSSSSSYSSYSSYTSSPLTRSTSAASTYSLTDPSSPSPSPTSPSPSSRPSQQSRFKTLSDAHWGEFESSGFLSPPSSLSTRGAKDIDQALKFDLTESARKARTAKRERGSVNWGDFVNGGFDMSDGGRKPLTLSMSSHSDYSPGHGSLLNTNASDLDKSYVGADGKLTNVADFALDTGLDAALQFNLTEFGILGGSATTKGADKDKLGDSKGERTITGISLGKRLKKKEKPLPPFTYDSTPLLLPGSETLIESAFVDVWTDLVSWGFAELGLSSGSAGAMSLVGDLVMGMWNSLSLSSSVNPDAKAMALSRSVSRDNDTRDGVEHLEKAKWRSELFKECNWVLVEFIALPSSPSLAHSSSDKDPRNSASLLLFEEYVPREYRAQLGYQLAGIHPSLILNSAYAHHPFNVVSSSSSSTSTPFQNQAHAGPSIARTRLGSLFSSPGNAGASSSTLGLVLNDSGRGKKEKAIKEAKKKKEKKEKKEKEKETTGPATFFSGSTRTLTSTPTPYDSRNKLTPTPTIVPHYSRAGRVQTPDSPLTPTGPNSSSITAIPRPAKDKSEEFDEMLADGNRGTKVITLNGALHAMGPDHGLSSDVEVEVTDGEAEEDTGLSASSNTTGHNEGSRREIITTLGSRHPLPSPPQPHSLQQSESTSLTVSTSSVPPSQDFSSTSTPIKNIFRLGTTSTLSPKPSPSPSKPMLKPKGPKPKTSRRQSKQNLVPAEYHTVEFETRLTGLGSGGESDDLHEEGEGGREKSDTHSGLSGTVDGESEGTTGDGFIEEAARRRRAARLVERERLRSERRGKRFSLGLGGKSGVGVDGDDEAWVDIVVPGYGAHRGQQGGEVESNSKGRSRRGDPEEASQEVARVLSAVRGGQPYPGIDDESIFEGQVDGAGKVNSDSDDIEVQTVPRFGKDGENGHKNNHDHHESPTFISGDLDSSYTTGDYDYPDAGEDFDHKLLTPSSSKHRLGYFDLHPERKRTSQEMLKQAAEAKDDLLNMRQPEAMSSLEADMFTSSRQYDDHSDVDEDVQVLDLSEFDEVGNEDNHEDDEDDPRARYAHGSDDEHDDTPRDLDKIYAAKTEITRPLPTLPPQNGLSSASASAYSATSPPRSSSLSPPSSPPMPLSKSTLVPVGPLSSTPPTKKSISPTSSEQSILTSTFGSTSGTPGKTAALIEMYREKERKTLSSSSPALPPAGTVASSNVPVKAPVGLPTIPKSVTSTAPLTSLAPSAPAPSLPTSPAAPVPVAKPLTKFTSPSPSSTSTVGINSQLHDEDDDRDDDDDVNGLNELIPPSKIGLGLGDDTGRASPGRYIHGAPLHNVLEEEEEEE